MLQEFIMEIIDNIYTKPSKSVYESGEFEFEVHLSDDQEIDRKWIRCRNCFNKIALISDKININHTDTHIFENPSGIFFRIICFSEAPGSVNDSEYTYENTWFPGYLWSISLCRSSTKHLGWHYDSGSGKFYGLIADRLAGV